MLILSRNCSKIVEVSDFGKYSPLNTFYSQILEFPYQNFPNFSILVFYHRDAFYDGSHVLGIFSDAFLGFSVGNIRKICESIVFPSHSEKSLSDHQKYVTLVTRALGTNKNSEPVDITSLHLPNTHSTV